MGKAFCGEVHPRITDYILRVHMNSHRKRKWYSAQLIVATPKQVHVSLFYDCLYNPKLTLLCHFPKGPYVSPWVAENPTGVVPGERSMFFREKAHGRVSPYVFLVHTKSPRLVGKTYNI